MNYSAVTKLEWKQLNDNLLTCEDVHVLQHWLDVTVRSGKLYRALRVHGRLNAVRRKQEIAAIRREIGRAA